MNEEKEEEYIRVDAVIKLALEAVME